MAFVDAMAGMMFFTTPWVSWYVTPCSNNKPLCVQQDRQRHLSRASIVPAEKQHVDASVRSYLARHVSICTGSYLYAVLLGPIQCVVVYPCHVLLIVSVKLLLLPLTTPLD
jgi:hypothetical protein